MPITAYIFIIIGLALSEAIYLHLARRFGVLAQPAVRSSHTRPTVVGGGLVFYLGVLAFSIASGMEDAGFFAAATLLAAVSFADDLHPLGVWIRLSVHFVSVAVAGIGICSVAALPWWLALVAAVCAVGFLNAWNFMDGINGLNGAYTALALGTLMYICVDEGPSKGFVDPVLLIVGLVAAVIFCVCNFRRRPLCFAGDVGSVTAAFIVLFPLVRLMVASGSIVWLCLVAVYGVDAVLTIIHRLARRCNIFQAHRMHLYQLLANEGRFGHLRVSAAYVVLQCVINMGLLLWRGNPYVYLGAVLAVLCAVYSVILGKLYGKGRKS